ncbi:FAD-dependent oxidoreductase [Streptomyces sp. URMC 126]|uniref:FAD-dependent oxidoreductase n=1 Tax=Streptomyces sp. URMC 126 TaxID=3423401 RepID=UPI003F1E2AD4
MNLMESPEHDVVVAGAGPVGLTLACELALAGTRVLVLERRTEVDRTIKAGAINTPSAEAFYRRGLLPALAEIQKEALGRFSSFAAGVRAAGEPAPVPAPRFAGHFAAIPLQAALLDASDPEFGDPGPAAAVGLVPQEPLERLLAERAAALGVEVRRGVTVTGLDADDTGVTVHTDAGEVRTGWLVGCDGGRSTVRKLAGFAFPGTDPEITGRQALVEMTGAEALGSGWQTTATGHYVHGPMPGRVLTVEFDGPPVDRDAPVTAREIEDSLRRVTGVDVTVTAVHTATRFTDNARQASTYRDGRVLLAGDAAHVHSPFGGQGLNLGIGDAVNLGWKLAATVHGWAPDGLLDTYTAERHPIGSWVLEWTRAQLAVMRPDPHARALRTVVRELLGTVEGTTHVVKRISGVLQRYDLPGGHPLTGRSAPDLAFADGSRLADHLRHGRALLVDLHDDPELRASAGGYGGRVDVLTAACPDRPGLAALLVRPDGCTAWAADTADGRTGVEAALRRWFGEPGRPVRRGEVRVSAENS